MNPSLPGLRVSRRDRDDADEAWGPELASCTRSGPIRPQLSNAGAPLLDSDAPVEVGYLPSAASCLLACFSAAWTAAMNELALAGM